MSVNFDVLSDIHVDFWVKSAQRTGKHKRFIEQRIQPKSDYIIIAGDISHGMKSGLAFLKQLKNFYKRVIVVFGNHDYYMPHSEKDKYIDYKEKMIDYENKLRYLGIDILTGQTIDVEGVKIFGTGMWYDFSYAKKIRQGISDFVIGHNWDDGMNDANWVKGLKGEHPLVSYKNNIELFNSELDKMMGDEAILADIIVSHISPLNDVQYMTEKFRYSLLTGCFAFDGKSIVETTTAKYWIYGHTHSIHEFDVAGTKLICNPLGYPNYDENNAKTRTIEIESV
eukprot:GHVR01040331.1.p1 GENE.GHVR01040331.1~~GHVR01040331.1.p1  ORF type:complete len:282 (-),score=40.29 GHVR01040331.1:332-1177(-)